MPNNNDNQSTTVNIADSNGELQSINANFPPEPEYTAQNSDAGKTSEECEDAKEDWITFELRRDHEKHPAWWSVGWKPEKKVLRSSPFTNLPYLDEPYDASLTDRTSSEKLKAGDAPFVNIPAGCCEISFPDFYSEIERWMEEKING